MGSAVRQATTGIRALYTGLLLAVLCLLILVAWWASQLSERSEVTSALPTRTTISEYVAARSSTPTPTVLPLNRITPALPLINITRAGYEAAHERWLAQGITDYEISIEHFAPWQCWPNNRVSDGGEKVGPIGSGAEFGTYRPCGTVESLFSMIDEQLKEAANPVDEWSSWTYWIVSFDRDLGYPNSVGIRTQPGVQINDISSGTNVKALKILKRVTPTVGARQ